MLKLFQFSTNRLHGGGFIYSEKGSNTLTITSVDHPNYKVLVVGGSGLNLVTSSTRYNLGASVFVSDGEIKRLAPLGEVIQIEV